MKWERVPLASVADVQLGKMLDKLKNKGIPHRYLANLNVRWGSFELSNLRTMLVQPHEVDRYCVQVGDIIMCEGGEPGRCAVWRDAGEPIAFQKALHRIRPNRAVSGSFLYYALCQSHAHGEIEALTTGSTIKHLPREQLLKLVVPLPPLPIQRRIAGILSAYDDLIEVNTRRIALLEDMARGTFEAWFGASLDGASGTLENGWRVGVIEDLYENLFDGPHATPKPSTSGPVFLGIKNIRDAGGIDLNQVRHIAADDFPTWTRRVLPSAGDIVFSYEATLHRYAIIPAGLVCCLGRRMALIRPKASTGTYLYMLLTSGHWRTLIECKKWSGSTVDRIPLTEFPAYPALVPPVTVLEEFHSKVSPVLSLVESLARQNANLRTQRDLLLPRLISGEIDVSELGAAA